MNLAASLRMLEEKYPDKKIIGNPVEYKGSFAVSMVDKTQSDSEPNWDSTIYAVNKNTGNIRTFSVLDELDFFTQATPINEET